MLGDAQNESFDCTLGGGKGWKAKCRTRIEEEAGLSLRIGVSQAQCRRRAKHRVHGTPLRQRLLPVDSDTDVVVQICWTDRASRRYLI